MTEQEKIAAMLEWNRLLVRELQQVRGATFGSISAETFPKPVIKKTMTGASIILFSTDGESGYEGMVRRRLVQSGKDPSKFAVGNLPWGRRIGDSPVIEHEGRYYVQAVILDGGEIVYTKASNGRVIHNPKAYGVGEEKYLNQGLPLDAQVLVKVFNLDHVTEIKFLGASYHRPV